MLAGPGLQTVQKGPSFLNLVCFHSNLDSLFIDFILLTVNFYFYFYIKLCLTKDNKEFLKG